MMMEMEKYDSANETMLKVVEQNNLGVQFYEARNYHAAVNFFRGALESITSPSVEGATSLPAPPQQCLSGAIDVAVNPCAPILKAQLPSEDSPTDVQTFHCFSQAMEIVPSPTAYSENPMANEMIISAIVIWNMAVVYHCTSKGAGNRLRRAYALYLKSWSLVENLVFHGSRGNSMIDFFTQALLNNLGGCCQELGDLSDSRFWSDQLIAYAQSVGSPMPDETSEVSTRLQEQTNHFVLNAIMRLQCRPSHLAAAA
jgi:hypothetical protein